MQTTDEFIKKTYGEKLYKICFNAHMSCPNRDGTIGKGGCIFCSDGGSGEFAVNITPNDTNLDSKMEEAKAKVSGKFSGSRYIAYFQAFSNTYESADVLRQLYLPIVRRNDIAVLSIATRPDCLSDEILKVLKELNDIKPVWVELGFQTSKEESIKYIRRGYDNSVYINAVNKLKSLGIYVITHVILYLPGETKEDMLSTVKYVVNAGSDGIKLQVLQILKGSDLHKDYEVYITSNEGPKFTIPTLEEYVEILKECLSLIPENVTVHRLTGDPPKQLLIEPKWSADKKKVMNTIRNALDTVPYYVYMLECADKSLYTGSTNDIVKRYIKHSTGKGGKYTRSHLPVKLVYAKECTNKSAALKYECELKLLSRKEKLDLIENADKDLLMQLLSDERMPFL